MFVCLCVQKCMLPFKTQSGLQYFKITYVNILDITLLLCPEGEYEENNSNTANILTIKGTSNVIWGSQSFTGNNFAMQNGGARIFEGSNS